MKDIKTIIAFAKEICSLYSITFPEYSNYLDADTNKRIRYDKMTDYKYDASLIVRDLSHILGMNDNDIADTNKRAAKRIYQKYPFFELFDYYNIWKKTHSEYVLKDGRSPSNDDILLARIFNQDILKQRYNQEDLLQRLKQYLIECDKFLPGSYHSNAEITCFEYQADTFFDFVDYSKMMESFFELYDRMVFLFFKALKKDLPQTEINEYNLLISFFKVKDCISFDELYYHNLYVYRDVYITEGYHEFDSFAKIGLLDFEPWKCRQFVEFKDLAQRYQDIFPNTKDNILDACMQAKNIWCSFIWSDAPFEKEFDYFGNEVYSNEREITEIYIPKTRIEIGKDAEYAALLSKFASTESSGGLIRKKTEFPDLRVLFERSARRDKAMEGKNG